MGVERSPHREEELSPGRMDASLRPLLEGRPHWETGHSLEICLPLLQHFEWGEGHRAVLGPGRELSPRRKAWGKGREKLEPWV